MVAASERSWWKSAVFYQIYPRSFADSSGNGVGDLAGITSRLDYLQWLGVDALWLSPFYPSPMHDFGYDVSDFCDVDPLFGNLADFDRLVEQAHARDIRVIIDWVPAHTSSEHAWFRDAYSSRSSPRRDWYVWRDPGPNGELPNNWCCTFSPGEPAWTLDEGTGQYYLHSFLPQQPDLNWANPAVVEAMHGTLRFWLDRGVDGFRADVVHNIGKDPELANVDAQLAKLPHTILNDVPQTHEYLRGLRNLIDSYSPERMIVGEVFLPKAEQIVQYYGSNDELQLCFHFPAMFSAWQASAWHDVLKTSEELFTPRGVRPAWVLSNHDFKRVRTRHGTPEVAGDARARTAAVLLLTLPGTPFLYMGEELGLEDAEIPPNRAVDPGGRDGCRAPFPWDATPQHGWPHEPWLPWAPEVEKRNVDALRAETDSILHLYRRLLRVRRESQALLSGGLALRPIQDDVLVYERISPAERMLIAVNFTSEGRKLELHAPHWIKLSSDGRQEGQPFKGELAADQGLILVPAAQS